MQSVINSPSKDEAIKEASNFLEYFPFRYAAIVELKSGHWGWVSGKTMARMNNLVKKGYSVYMVKKG